MAASKAWPSAFFSVASRPAAMKGKPSARRNRKQLLEARAAPRYIVWATEPSLSNVSTCLGDWRRNLGLDRAIVLRRHRDKMSSKNKEFRVREIRPHSFINSPWEDTLFS